MDDGKNPFNKEEDAIQTESKVKVEDLKECLEDKAENMAEAEETTTEQPKDSNNDKYEDLNNKYLRLAADFDNFRKRTAVEKQDLLKYGASEVLKKILTVLDTFDRAKDSLKDIDNCQTVKDSYELAYKQLIDTLKKLGMEEIEALGQEFNPSEHEAVTQVQTDEYDIDHVAVVVQKVYKLADKVLRPALVGVAKKKENE